MDFGCKLWVLICYNNHLFWSSNCPSLCQWENLQAIFWNIQSFGGAICYFQAQDVLGSTYTISLSQPRRLLCSQAWTATSATTPALQGCPPHHAWSSALYAGPLLGGRGCHPLYGVSCAGLALTLHSGTTALAQPLCTASHVLLPSCLGAGLFRKENGRGKETKPIFKWPGHVFLQWT